jgi:hypothetical protein
MAAARARSGNKKTPSMEVRERQTPDEVQERRGPDRRKHVLRSLVYGSFHPRRRAPRRADERSVTSVDWHHPQWLAIGMLIVMFSCGDAFLTMMLITKGAYEVNPVMAPLLGGSALGFALVKIGLTAGGVVVLTLLARLRTFGRIPVGVILYSVLALYGTLILYEFHLLGRL